MGESSRTCDRSSRRPESRRHAVDREEQRRQVLLLLFVACGAVEAQQLDLLAVDLRQRGQAPPQALLILREPLGDRAAAAHAQHDAHGAVILRFDQGEDRVPHPRVGYEPCVLARDVEIDVRERLLDFVHDEPEQAGVGEHPLEERVAAGAAYLQERGEPAPDAVPPRHEVSVLAPGEDPGDGAQIGERLRPEARSSVWYAAVPRFAYLKDTTSPCSVRRSRPWIEPLGWAAMARPVGAPPRLTEPPRPWKKAIGTPHARPSRVSRSWVLASSQLDERKPPSLFESEYPIITSNTPPWARTLRRTSGTCSRSRTISGARRRSSMDSNSGTIGSVQLSTPAASANRPACLASRYTPRMSATSCVMLRMKVPTASRSRHSRTS